MDTTTLIAAIVLVVVHLGARALTVLDAIPRSRWLSLGSGVSVAYVFLHLLPEVAALEVGAFSAGDVGSGWLVAVTGLVVFYGLERAAGRTSHGSENPSTGRPVGWLHVASYTIYNAIVGYLLHEEARHGTETLVLYTVALGVHFVVNDHGLRARHGALYDRAGRWLVSAGVLLGWGVGATTALREAAIGLAIAFLAGGIVLNVLKEELPEERQARLAPFVAGVVGYGALLAFV